MQGEIKKSGLMVLKGSLITLVIALIGVLIFSAVVKTASLGVNVIKPVNQFIKVLAVFLGCFFSLKGSKGYIKGGLCGIIGITLIFFTFAMISGSITFDLSFLIDIAFGLAIGVVSGILTVNIKSKN